MSEPLADTLPLSGHLGIIIGKFRLERRLGSGAMGDVFLGVHTTLGSLVAIKILNATATAEPTGVERFLNEAKAVAAIGHENIASVIDHDHLPDGTPYIVMEFVEGTTLRDLLTVQGALPLRLATQLALDVLSALTAAHGKGIVHRDLKPENIRVTPSERAKVLDFGVAKLLHSPSTGLSTDGAIIGTPHYMAPEQVAAKPLDGRADVYSVGVMLFECVTGRRPFEGSNLIELLQRQVHAAPPWPHHLRADIPPELEEVILKALEKDATRRFDSAEHMAMELRVLLPSLSSGQAPSVSGRAPQTATPGGHAYTPTRKELASATPSPNAERQLETEPMPRPSRALPLTVLFVALVVVAAGATYAVQVQSQPPSAELMHRPAPTPAVEKPKVAEAPVDSPPPVIEVVALPLPAVVNKKKPVVVASRDPLPVPEPVGEQQPPAKPQSTPGEITYQSTGATIREFPIDYDPKNVSLLGYAARARELAKQQMSDSIMITMYAEGVAADGHADLTLKKGFEVNYWFRSPSRSHFDPALPNRDQDVECKVYVILTAAHLEVRSIKSSDCHEKPLPPVHCTMPQVMQRGIEEGARPNQAAKVSYLTDGTWMVDQGDERGDTQYFDCPAKP